MSLEIGERIRLSRELREWTQIDLARESGLANSTISDYEHGRSQPSPHAIRLLAGAMGLTPSYLMFGETLESDLSDEESSLLLHWRRKEWGKVLFMLAGKVDAS